MANHNLPAIPGVDRLDDSAIAQIKISHMVEPWDSDRITRDVYRLAEQIRRNWSPRETLRRAGVRLVNGEVEGLCVPLVSDRGFCEAVECGEG